MSKRKVHLLRSSTVTECGTFIGFEGVQFTEKWQEATCLSCIRPRPKVMTGLHAEALIINEHRGLPRECPDGSGRLAPDGQHWARNARFGGWVLEEDGTPWSLSVSSDAYWQN